MEKKEVLKRLYVGGLGHTISKAELQERFGKFGHVLDAEIITRRDEQGNPVKTFAYITVSISETDFRKCMSILNKAKWKGGTLQIELAKESFLHRLAMEREEAKMRKEKPRRDDKRNLVESLKEAGIVDFHMKAVPGTEVPGHKNWVVGKFGRVLPVLHLKNQQKNQVVKYDPSKYCHNLRKLEQDVTHVVPVSELTWHLEGRDDSMSKKRQGDFPLMAKSPKKMRQVDSEDLKGTIGLPSGCQLQSTNIRSSQRSSKSDELSKLFPSICKTSGRDLPSEKSSVFRGISQKSMVVSDSNSDSEEEIRAVIKKEMERQKAEINVEAESDHLEIVGDDFKLKYNTHWSLDNADTMKKVIKGRSRDKDSMECDNGYDSADTDEIIAVSRSPELSSRKTTSLEDCKQVKLWKNSEKEILTNKKCDLVKNSSLKMQNLKEEKVGTEGKKKSKIPATRSTSVNNKDKTSDSENSCSESEELESDTSYAYESMMQNCYRLDLTLDDLKALAAENADTSVEDADYTQSASECTVKENAKDNITHHKKHSKISPAVEKCVCPDDIVAALLEEEENANGKSVKEQDNSGLKYQPFRGMGSLCEKEPSKDSSGLKKRSSGNLGFDSCFSCFGEESSTSQNTPWHSLGVSAEKQQNVGCDQLEELSDAAMLAGKSKQPICKPHLQGKSKYVNSQQEDAKSGRGDALLGVDESEDENSENSNMNSNALVSQKHIKGQSKSPKLLSKKLKRNVSSQNGKIGVPESKELCSHAAASKKPDASKKQLQDNQRRLAALEERQKERELQKKLIQGALSNLDSKPESVQKHIIFDSDVESESEMTEKMPEKDATLGNMLEKEYAPKTSGKLFESSEDEQDDTDDERFKIKPQFEGKAGEKLLHLQSRFGTDERFRLDARFIESDSEEEEEGEEIKIMEKEEEELAAEKKKNLQILGNLLNINLEHSQPTKTAAKAKKFKDINALRYDPTRQDHAVFERKPNATEKESKAKRKKKREESEKLPEVSKETYYDISVDLKELFKSARSEAKKSEEIPWDKDDAEESTSLEHQNLGPDVGSNVAQKSSGFTFSFFSDMDESAIKEEPYVLETIKPVKVAWQEDPRFQDSSSEDDEEPEVSKNEEDQEVFLSLPTTRSTRLFFFSKDDERLREGPKLFCRSINLNEEKETWEDRRRLLLEECRKKHKDARRKVRGKQ
ncbi:LOW QUALITY PROTEIN: nucleolar protein 8 [Eudromia elegans]